MTVKKGRFEWDNEKNNSNIKKHGLSFDEVIEVFDDPFFYEIYDKKHSIFFEDRFIGVGTIKDFTIVITVFTEKENIRIISARLATKNEEAEYYEKRNRFNC